MRPSHCKVLGSPLPLLPTPATQVARGLDSLRSLLPGGQFVAIVCSDFSRPAVVVEADVVAAVEHTFFALCANTTLMWGVLVLSEDQLSS